eukprot:TRINITY_DN70195_c0_g1_i1.p1 TRINITY_DN70195_c0_g1~~TRINITY_DN70195_c0_g1_i1.p1  ORF type:complete len:215 (+),score=31.37 TRINITY_DN70195_c0_g1_i1:44-688(+)
MELGAVEITASSLDGSVFDVELPRKASLSELHFAVAEACASDVRLLRLIYKESELPFCHSTRLEDRCMGRKVDLTVVITEPRAYRQQDAVQYFSATHKAWLPAVVTALDDSNQVKIDIKPGTWLKREEQWEKLFPIRCSPSVKPTGPQQVHLERPKERACESRMPSPEFCRQLAHFHDQDHPLLSKPHLLGSGACMPKDAQLDVAQRRRFLLKS